MQQKIRAFIIHFSASLLIALLSLVLIFFVWYPSPLHTAVGVTHMFLLLLGVDVTLGPLLTLVVYMPGKKLLLLDMLVIVALQLAALFYGLASVAEGRPSWLVFSADRFDLVRVLDIDARNLEHASVRYRKPGWLGPQWVGALEPVDAEQRNAIMFEALKGGSDLAQRPNLYRPLTEMKDQLRKQARPLADLEKLNASAAVTQVLSKWPAADAWMPMMASARSMTVLLNKEKAEVVALVDLRPWEE